LIPADNDPPLEVGTEGVNVTDEMVELANQTKGEAMSALREKRYQDSIGLFTKAIKNNPASGILYASRGQALLEMKKPNAAIRDCDVAIKIAPDSAKPYKVRGRARRALGNYEEALKDIQLGQKLDWDDGTHKFESELKLRVDSIVAKRKKKEEVKRKREEAKKSRGSHSHSHSHPHPHPDPDPHPQPHGGEEKMGGGNPFGMGGMPPEMMQKLMSDPELMQLFQDPTMLAKLQEIMTDPTKIQKYQNDPKVMSLLSKLQAFSD